MKNLDFKLSDIHLHALLLHQTGTKFSFVVYTYQKIEIKNSNVPMVLICAYQIFHKFCVEKKYTKCVNYHNKIE